ncbi:hypothetical protein OEZ86_013169 [Tetradesmus obliquus]|nr:hypothetical protein OEZ86_013169 [Tetradesmus obliquus]
MTRQQFVQATWALEGVTCAGVSNQLNDKTVNNTLAKAVIADFQAALNSSGWPEAAATVRAVRQPCLDIQAGDKAYASYRVMVRFNSTNTTSIRDVMFNATGSVSASRCSGGYSRLLYANVAALWARGPFTVSQNRIPFTVSHNHGNRQNSFYPGGAGLKGLGTNWIEYAGAVPLESGRCGCDLNTTTPAFKSSSLIACLNGTALTTCPPNAPISVRTQGAVPTIVSCITPNTSCPVNFTLPIYSGNPAVRIECRPNFGGCIYAGADMPITSANGSLIGCLNASSNACPFMAFRSAPSFTLDACQDVSACPVFNASNSNSSSTTAAHTVPALPAGATNSTKPAACLSLGSNQCCPDNSNAPGLNLSFPIEVMFTEPVSPVCGGSNICQSARTLQCLATNAACPASYTFRLFGAAAAAGTVPELLECRQPRSLCDLTAIGMNATLANAGTYDVEVRTGDALDGCVAAGTLACPPSYPFSYTGPTNTIAVCRSNQGVTCNPATQVPLINAIGTVDSCMSASLLCPNSYPVTLRKDTAGRVGGCMVLNGRCPSAYNTALYGFFTALTSISSSTLTLVNCWATGVITNCANVIVTSANVPAGSNGTYPIPISTSDGAGGLRVLGCMKIGATACPPEFPFSFLDFSGTSRGTSPPTAAIVDRCAPAAELSACPAFAADPISGMPSYYKPAFNRTALSGCIKFYTTAGAYNGNAPRCPAPFPIVAITRNDPLTVADQSQVAACYSASSTCAADAAVTAVAPANAPPLNFTLITGEGLPIYCVFRITGISSCSAYPAGAYTAGLPFTSPDGSTWTGCSSNSNACPPEFPLFFQNDASPPVIRKCQAALAPNVTCAAASNGTSPIALLNTNNTVIGCSGPALACNAGQLILATTAGGPPVGCSGNLFSCTDPGFPFPLYESSSSSGSRIARCLPPQAAASCDAAPAIFGNYTVEVSHVRL